MSPRLRPALEAAWAAAAALPDDDPSFDSLTPHERRELHDLGVRTQDRLVRCLARLTQGMAEDGADLLDERGLPHGFGARASSASSDQST